MLMLVEDEVDCEVEVLEVETLVLVEKLVDDEVD